jgi:hypothetical protein
MPPALDDNPRLGNFTVEQFVAKSGVEALDEAVLAGTAPTLHPVISHLSRACGVMISKADAIIIGSGGLGAAKAYYLSRRKKLGIALIDKHDSQTSSRAAGMVSCARNTVANQDGFL